MSTAGVEFTNKLILVPAIDLLDGKVVRVKQGREEESTIYSTDPVSTAEQFLSKGARLIHLVDLGAALHGETEQVNNHARNLLLSKFCGTPLKFQVGGGIRSKKAALGTLESCAFRIVLSSIAYDNLEEAKSILSSSGSKKTVLALDYDEKGFVRSHGWKRKQAERVEDALLRFNEMGFAQFLTTSVANDGMLSGPDTPTLRKLRDEFPSVRLIASGGVSCEKDIEVLSNLGIDEVVVGKALYTGAISQDLLSVYS